MNDHITLYKSLSPVELAVIIRSGWAEFFPASPDQKIFSPKLHLAYAEMLARQLEAACHNAGYVVAFRVPRNFLSHFELQTIGYLEHQEYWIPVAELGALNAAIAGRIRLVSAFTMEDNLIWQQVNAQRCVGYH